MENIIVTRIKILELILHAERSTESALRKSNRPQCKGILHEDFTHI